MAYTNTVGPVEWFFIGHSLMLGKCMTCGARIKVRLAASAPKEDREMLELLTEIFEDKHRHE